MGKDDDIRNDLLDSIWSFVSEIGSNVQYYVALTDRYTWYQTWFGAVLMGVGPATVLALHYAPDEKGLHFLLGFVVICLGAIHYVMQIPRKVTLLKLVQKRCYALDAEAHRLFRESGFIENSEIVRRLNELEDRFQKEVVALTAGNDVPVSEKLFRKADNDKNEVLEARYNLRQRSLVD